MLETPQLQVRNPNPFALVLVLSGDWVVGESLPSAESLETEILERSDLRRVGFDVRELATWDSALLTFLVRIRRLCSSREMDLDVEGLPPGAQRLLDLAFAVPPKEGTGKNKGAPPLLVQIGTGAMAVGRAATELVDFLGRVTQSFGRLVVGKARFRGSDLAVIIEDCGPRALPIVTLISLLVGAILAFVGAVQLKQFGAQIFVADLVTISVTREMGAMMTGIIMAGRTGAAFAAHLGTMTVNEEIDALETMGISPMDFLVLPRLLALALMTPLLTIYADLMGIIGGGIVGVTMLDLPVIQYANQTLSSLSLNGFFSGLIKGSVFGVLVAISGCLKGMGCGRSASAVGEAATGAVVMGLVLIICSDMLLTVIYTILGL